MVVDLFSASRLKLQRAEKFIRELECELKRYRASDPVRAHYDFKQTPPVIILNFDGITDLPGAIVGDAIHNMRTALDLMASELVRQNGKSDNKVYFPFADKASNLDDVITSKNFHKAGSDAVALLKKYEPYRGGNESLRAIHDLDIRDKHKALVLMGATRTIEVEGSYDVESLVGHHITITKHDVYYVFPEDGAALSGRPVIETLKELVKLVNGIVEAFTSMVALRNAPNS